MPNKKIIYLLGAGFNQCVKDWDGLKPPLATNFFQNILKSRKYSHDHYLSDVESVYSYIERYWKKSKEDLLKQPQDIEEVFTFIELQFNKAIEAKDDDRVSELQAIYFKLKTMLAAFLSEFDIHSHSSEILKDFGSLVYKQKPTFITFNYDCILESAIESASGGNPNIPKSFRGGMEIGEVPDEELPYSHNNWNSPLGYGIKFNKVQLQRAGVSEYVDGNRFYSHPKNNLYDWKILKLHGSLNWFKYLPIRKYPAFPGKEEQLVEEKLKEVMLLRGHWWFNEPPDLDGWYIDPLIITPVLYKEIYYREKLFSDIWEQAKDCLEQCSKLVVIGYSFPPTDFATKKLLLEAFENNELDELIVVNPNTEVVKIIKELTHFNKPVSVCSNLEEFLKSYSRER